ncbi:RimJ/RimL family protein N-acetyltransferase [Streptomyces carminius]|uniref:RimJ/RimL family protein N-acetyltransferase n=1 Tax=Streptomyces carminius TaxID=2665496 RepID=A0A2M8LSQ1_9ACTN|nr:GNAT family protein [Streptomyces carminius]PJE94981.1 RimJ/RimL family protein N-acetyltransferase [Streptomyces carminius]
MLSTPLGDGAALCPLEPWQAAELAAYTDRVRDHLTPWLPWAHSVTDTASARAFLQRYADEQAADRGRLYGIRLGGALVGGMMFRLFDVREGSCELGAWLAPEAQGRGLVTTAAHRMIDWAVGDRGIARVEWLVSPANGPSIAVAKRLGMTYEGTLRSVFAMGGRRQDLQVWALLGEEWRTGRGWGGAGS